MKDPLYYKYDIPIFVTKSDKEFRADKYEHFYPTVLRNLVIHTGDHLWKERPYETVFSRMREYLPSGAGSIIDLGCGIGRIAADLALKRPECQFYGVDYSLMMLKEAQKLWKSIQTIEIDGSDYGYVPYSIQGQYIQNLTFLQATAEQLPWYAEEIDLVYSIFLLDKVSNPDKVLSEIKRILRPAGKVLIVIPFNFQERTLWKKYHPFNKFRELWESIGLKLVFQDDLIIKEPIDFHGNCIHWKAKFLVLTP